jgi:hypothetical protein
MQRVGMALGLTRAALAEDVGLQQDILDVLGDREGVAASLVELVVYLVGALVQVDDEAVTREAIDAELEHMQQVHRQAVAMQYESDAGEAGSP